MPAEVDTMMWLKQDGAPWHGEGVMLEEPPKTGREAMEAALMDWEVEACPKFDLLPAEAEIDPETTSQVLKFKNTLYRDEVVTDAEGTELTDEQGNVRTVRRAYNEEYEGKIVLSSTQSVWRKDKWAKLGDVGGNYETVQNLDAFSFFDEALGTGEVEYRTAGSLRGGRIIWVLASLPESMIIGRDDEVARFLLLATSHDGSMAVWILITPIRVVCNNTLTSALDLGTSGNRMVNRIWHTKGVNERLIAYADVLAHANEVYERTGEAFNILADYQMTALQFDGVLDALFPLPPARPQKTQTTRDRITELFEGAAMGYELGSSQGTAWGLYNAITEWTDHERGLDRSRLHQAWMGEGAKLKERALWHLLELTQE